MKHPLECAFVVLSICLVVVSAQHMAVLPSGYVKAAEKDVKLLKWGSRICPFDYDKGFAIECRNGMVPPVRFFVDGKPVRTTGKWPYTIAASGPGWRSPWKYYHGGSKQMIECRSAHGGPMQTAEISYGCSSVPKSANVMPGLPVKKAPTSRPRSASTPSRSPIPSPTPKSMESTPPTPPPTGLKYRWVGHRSCVMIDASRPDGPLTDGWTREAGGGVTWRANDNWGGVVAPGTSPLTYSFEVPKESTYAITLDMETGHWTEHNDVFLRFQYGGGVALRRPGINKNGGTWYHKAYHNQNGRAIEAKTVDNFGHSFSTIAVLKPGVKYYISIGARSTKTTVHNIVLFPCSEHQCSGFSGYWQDTVKTCK